MAATGQGTATKASAADQSKAKIPVEAQVDPKELDKLKKSVLGNEQAPTSAQQTPGTTAWQNLRDVLGPPFDAERVTLAQMRQLRKDPMIAFGLHYRKVPIARAEWFIEARDNKGVNAQIAAFCDAVLRRIWARFVFQRTLALDFGFQAIVKRWVLSNPGGVYADNTQLDPFGNPTLKPIWAEGNVLPTVWTDFVPLRPEAVAPIFDPKTEEFAGIAFTAPTTSAAQAKKQSAGKAGAAAKGVTEIDIYHALWATNQRDAEHGSIYGYPLTGYARDYWWTYKFLFGLSNRAYERLAIPPVLALHPEGSTVIDNLGNTRENWQIALEMAERLRSNAVAAVPSTMAEAGIGETSNTQRAWDFKFLETPFEAVKTFDDRFNYLNVMKLRSVWVPELAFTGGEVGRTGGNVAEQMAEVFTQSQQLLMEEIINDVNRYMLPQLLWMNFPEFVNAGGTARVVSRGFRAEDMDLYKQVLQLIGQTDPAKLADLDMHELLRRIGLPLKDPALLAAERQRMATVPGAVPNVPGATVANPNINPGFTNGGSVPVGATPGAQPTPTGGSAAQVAGFGQPYIYAQPNEEIHLEFAEVDDFLASLPGSKHYSDKEIRALSVQLRRLWAAYYRRLYPQLAKSIAKTKIEFADEETEETLVFDQQGLYFARRFRPVNFVSKAQATKVARRLLEEWSADEGALAELRDKSAEIMRKILKRAMRLDMRDAGMAPEIDESAIDTFITEQSGRLMKFTTKSFTDEVRDHLISEIREGKTSGEIADGLVSRFESFPRSRAERIARSETRDVVNAGTLISGEAAGVRYVKATDGEQFDEECRKRNGKLFTIREAWKQMRKEHPYGTLGFNLMPRANFSIEAVHNGTWPEERADQVAYFDDESSTVYYRFGEISDDDLDTYLSTVFDMVTK